MTIKTQQGSSVPQLDTVIFACLAVLCAAVSVPAAVAEGAALTPTHVVRPHRPVAETVRNLHENRYVRSYAVRDKSYAVQPRGRKLTVQDVPAKQSAKKTPAEPATKKPRSSSAQRTAPKAGAVPHVKSRQRKREDDAPSADPPVMFKAKAGQRGSREGLVRVRSRWVMRGPVFASSRLASVGPAPLRGSHDILVHQNLMADDEGLERIQNEEDLDRLRASHDLVDFDESRSLRVNPELPWNRRCARLWTVKFVQDLAAAFYAKFGQPLEVNSAARSVEYQLRLAHTNGNAAGIDGDAASPHLTGQAIDLGKRDMNRAQLAWMRSRLLPLIQTGKIDVEEEFRQACFHVSVYRSYLPVTRALPKRDLAQLRPQAGTKPVDNLIPSVPEANPQP